VDKQFDMIDNDMIGCFVIINDIRFRVQTFGLTNQISKANTVLKEEDADHSKDE